LVNHRRGVGHLWYAMKSTHPDLVLRFLLQFTGFGWVEWNPVVH
jgi:hypothetical protein